MSKFTGTATMSRTTATTSRFGLLFAASGAHPFNCPGHQCLEAVAAATGDHAQGDRVVRYLISCHALGEVEGAGCQLEAAVQGLVSARAAGCQVNEAA